LTVSIPASRIDRPDLHGLYASAVVEAAMLARKCDWHDYEAIAWLPIRTC
jgi:hypothetical protein